MIIIILVIVIIIIIMEDSYSQLSENVKPTVFSTFGESDDASMTPNDSDMTDDSFATVTDGYEKRFSSSPIPPLNSPTPNTVTLSPLNTLSPGLCNGPPHLDSMSQTEIISYLLSKVQTLADHNTALVSKVQSLADENIAIRGDITTLHHKCESLANDNSCLNNELRKLKNSSPQLIPSGLHNYDANFPASTSPKHLHLTLQFKSSIDPTTPKDHRQYCKIINDTASRTVAVAAKCTNKGNLTVYLAPNLDPTTESKAPWSTNLPNFLRVLNTNSWRKIVVHAVPISDMRSLAQEFARFNSAMIPPVCPPRPLRKFRRPGQQLHSVVFTLPSTEAALQWAASGVFLHGNICKKIEFLGHPGPIHPPPRPATGPGLSY